MTEAGRARVARWVSVLLHPFAVFAALAAITAWRVDPQSLPRVVIGIAVAIGMVWGFVLQRRRSGRWTTVDASRPHERPALYALVLVVAFAYWAWLGGRGATASGGVLATVAMLAVAALLNHRTKLSLHMASLAFAGGVLLSTWALLGLVALGLLPLLGWSRVAMGRHAPSEVLGGTALGLLAASGLRLLA